MWDHHQIHIAHNSLRNLYLRHKINYRRSRTMNKDLIATKQEHLAERSDSAWRLLTLLMNHAPMVYIDETSVQINTIKAKTWQLPDSAIYAPRNNRQLETVTVYGGIATPGLLPYPLLMAGRRTTGD